MIGVSVKLQKPTRAGLSSTIEFLWVLHTSRTMQRRACQSLYDCVSRNHTFATVIPSILGRRLAHVPRATGCPILSNRFSTSISRSASPKVEAIFQRILQLDLVEVHLLTEIVNERMGVSLSEAQRTAMAKGVSGESSSPKAEASTAAAEAVKTTFELKLVSFDDKSKIKVIKEVRAITGLGLKEAKDLVESSSKATPKVLKKDIKKEEAETLKAKLAESGAVIEIV